jgi:hypothetical protein
MLPNETIERQFAGSSQRFRPHAIAKPCELDIGLSPERGGDRLVKSRARGLEQITLQLGQPGQESLSSFSAKPVSGSAGDVELAGNRIDDAIELFTDGPPRSRRCQAQQRPLEVGRERRDRSFLVALFVRLLGDIRRLSRKPDGPAPLVERVEHIGFAEIDLQRTTTGTLAMISFETAIDSAERDSEGNALGSPAGNQIERRPDHANQVTVILPAQVGFDVPAVVRGLQSEICTLRNVDSAPR